MRLSFSSDWKALDGESEWLEAEKVVHAKTPQGLIQAVGYAKYKLGQESVVYYRGQQSNYKTMYPSLYRQKEKRGGVVISKVIAENERRKRSDILDMIMVRLNARKVFLRNTPENAIEGLLQHYGMNTRCIDIVDNVWSALWFACHSVRCSVHSGNIMHVSVSNNEFSYIYVLCFGKLKKVSGGVFETFKNYQIVDLRAAAPSLYLRPHAQHGLVAKRINKQLFSKSDFTDIVGVTVKINTNDALEWIGGGKLLLPGNIYPSSFFDAGYAKLLRHDEIKFYNELIAENIQRYKTSTKMREVFGSIKHYSY